MFILGTALMFVEVIIAILLIVVILLQQGKSGGMGAVSGGGDSMFGGKARGIDSLLSKLTIILAIVFAVFSLLLDVALNTY